MADAVLRGVDGCDAQKEKVAAGHEGVGRTVNGLFLVYHDGWVGQGIVGELGDEADVHPAEGDTGFAGDFFGKVDFMGVFLSIGETQGVDFLEVLLGPEKTGCRVLTAAKHDQGTGVVQFMTHWLLVV